MKGIQRRRISHEISRWTHFQAIWASQNLWMQCPTVRCCWYNSQLFTISTGIYFYAFLWRFQCLLQLGDDSAQWPHRSENILFESLGQLVGVVLVSWCWNVSDMLTTPVQMPILIDAGNASVHSWIKHLEFCHSTCYRTASCAKVLKYFTAHSNVHRSIWVHVLMWIWGSLSIFNQKPNIRFCYFGRSLYWCAFMGHVFLVLLQFLWCFCFEKSTANPLAVSLHLAWNKYCSTK